MSVARQGRYFIVVGVVQWLTDSAVMVALSHLGVVVATANIAGRVAGACLGFWLNGTVTFSNGDEGPGRRQFARYAVVWCLSAVLSTILVSAIAAWLGLRWAWLAKPLVDALLGACSFAAARYWVYR